MELRQIRYARAVARFKNFSKAAESLYITQQTLSQQIRRLEDEIGFDIFERSTRSVSLTEKGKMLLDKAIPMLKSFDAFASEIDLLREDPISSLRVGILPTFSHLNILEAVHEFQTQHLTTSVNLQIQMSSRLLDMLFDGQIDAAIANISSDEMAKYKRNFVINVFSHDQICAVIHRKSKFATIPQLSVADFDNEPILLLSKGSSIRNCMEAAFLETGVIPSAIFDCPEIHSMIGMLHAGMGVGFLSSRIAEQYTQASIKCVKITPPLETITALMYNKANIKIDALTVFSEFIKGMHGYFNEADY